MEITSKFQLLNHGVKMEKGYILSFLSSQTLKPVLDYTVDCSEETARCILMLFSTLKILLLLVAMVLALNPSNAFFCHVGAVMVHQVMWMCLYWEDR